MLIITIMSLFLLACSPSSTNESTTDAIPDTTESQIVEIAKIEIPSTITYDGLWFRESLDGSGTRQLDVGEVVHIIGEKEADSENADRFYVPIRLTDGTEGWTSEWFTIPETVPGVLTQNAKIYSEPKLSKLTTKPDLTAMSIVAVGAEGDVNGFVRISYSTPDGYAKIDEYIKSEFISKDTNDIMAAHLYTLAMTSDDEGMKAEFLNSASEVRSPAFGIFVDQAMNGVVEDLPNNLTIDTIIILEDGVMAHENPDANTPVTAIFKKNDILGTIGRSKTKGMVNGIEDWWYALEGGGWVFGADITVN